MEKMAKRITNWLIAKEVIAIEEREIYEYGIFHLLLNTADTASILLLALLFHEIIAVCCYIACFCTLRKYAGGYHAKTVFGCYLLTVTAALCMLVLLQLFEIPSLVLLVLWLISSVMILLFAPVQNRNKRLDEVESVVYKKRTMMTWGIQAAVMILLYSLGFKNYFEAMLMAHTYVALSMMTEKFHVRSVKKGD